MRKFLPLAVVIAVAVLLRLQNLTSVFSDGFYPQGFDPYYYMRLAEVIPHTGWVKVDYYVNYPFGYKIGWLPGYAYLLSLPIIAFGYGIGEVVDAFIPVLLAVVSTFMVYLIAMKFGEDFQTALDIRYYAVISAFFFAISPIIVYRSVVGFTDHHIWVLALLLFSIYFILAGENLKEKILFSLVAGISLSLLAFSWRGAPIYSAILALSLFMYLDAEEIRLRSLSFILPVSSTILSASIGISFLLIFAFLFVGSIFRERNLALQYSASAIAAVLVLYFVPLSYFKVVRGGIDYLLSRNVILSTIVEAKSFQIMDMLWITGFIVAIFSFVGFVMYRNNFLRTWFLASLTLTLFQLRFAEVWIFPVALLAAYVIFMLFERGMEDVKKSRKKSSKKSKKSKIQSGKAERKIPVSDIAAAAFLIAFISSTSIIASATPNAISEDWKNALTWIKENTEKTSYYLQPDKKPEYSILAWWNYGNWIVYEAKRPVVANNFQVGAKDAAKFFLSQNESEAMKIIKKRGVKYVITTDMERIEYYFASVMITAGLNPEKMDLNEILRLYNNSMFYKLHVEDARNLKHFSLLRIFGSVKIFEVV